MVVDRVAHLSAPAGFLDHLAQLLDRVGRPDADAAAAQESACLYRELASTCANRTYLPARESYR